MNYKEYGEVKALNYQQYCEYLKEKYGEVPYEYGNKKNRRPGLFIHHIGEDKIPSLSSREARKTGDHKYQLPDMLCYCDYLEHFLLHLKIGEISADYIIMAMAGLETWIKPALINFYDHGIKNARVSEEYYNLIQDDKDVFEILLNEHDSLVKKQDLVFDHNAALFLQLDDLMSSKGRALVVLGTGLGKTTTGLQYLKKHNTRALVLGPNNLIKNGWDQYPEYCDTMTYQSFSNNYEKIDYSKYGCVILDEAHHAAYDEEIGRGAKIWGNAINYLVNNNIKILGLTATPDRTDGISLGESLFKDCVCKGLSVEEGIENGILYPFSYVTSIYDKSGITEDLPDIQYQNDEEYVKLRGQLDLALNNLPTIPTSLLKYMPHNSRKGIIFVQDIEDMDIALKIFRKAFPKEEVRFLHSKQTKAEQDESREWFKKTTNGYLMAVNMITEGAHYDGVNTLIMFRRTESYLLYTQQLGRIITLTTKNNPEAIVFDLVNNINSIKYNDRVSKHYKEPANKEILKVLRKIEESKSAQIIVANETQDITDRLNCLKQYTKIHYWSEEEDSILKEHYPNEGAAGCLKYFPFLTITALQARASKLGIVKIPNWTPEEDDFLRENYQKLSAKELSEYLNRTTAGVTCRLSLLKLKKQSRNYWSEEEENILKTNYGEGINLLMELLPNRTKAMIKNRIKKLKLHSKVPNWSDEEIEIIKQYYPSEGKEVIARRLPNRTPTACELKARQLGLSHQELVWTPELISILKKYYPEEGIAGVCKRLPATLTKTAIRTKVSELKIKFNYSPKVWTDEEINILKQYYPTEGLKVQSRLNKNKNSIQNKVFDLKLKHPNGAKVRCVETGEVFNSITQANKKYPGAENLKSVIEGKSSSAGRLPDGTKLHWKYVEETIDSENN